MCKQKHISNGTEADEWGGLKVNRAGHHALPVLGLVAPKLQKATSPALCLSGCEVNGAEKVATPVVLGS